MLFRSGVARARLHAAEAVLDNGAELFTECCQRGADGGRPFSQADDLMINMLAREALTAAWHVLSDTVMRASGSSALTADGRLARIWRDMTMAWGHANAILRNETSREYTRNYLAERTSDAR